MNKNFKKLLLASLLFGGVIGCSENPTSSITPSLDDSSTSEKDTSEEATTSENTTSSEETTTLDITTTSENQTTENEFGELVIEDMVVYKNYKMRPYVTFTKDKETISYSFEGNDISIDNGVISVINENKTVKVKATTEHLETTFTVSTKGNFIDYQSKVTTRKNDFIEKGEQYGETLFLGDSFFDVGEFWTNFYDLFPGKNVRSVGISASTTTDWEIFAEDLIYPSKPKNVVIHCGTNNIFDDKKDSQTTYKDVKRLIEQIHNVLGETNIYYFGIEPRTYGANGKDIPTTVSLVKETNNLIKEFCDDNSYLTYLDSPSLCYNDDGSVKSSFFRDGTHPKIENYSYYVNLLKEAGIVYEENTLSKINDFSTTTASTVGDSHAFTYKGISLNREFALEGTLKIKTRANNAHIQFAVDNTNFQNRFLLWDAQSNGNFKLGYAVNANHVSTAPDRSTFIKGNDDLILTWKILITEKNAYLYINNNLEAIMINIPNDSSKAFRIGTENVAVDFYNMTAICKATDEAEYNTLINNERVQKYEELVKTDSSRKVIRDYEYNA